MKLRILALGIPAFFCGSFLVSCAGSDSAENRLVSLSPSAVQNSPDDSPPASVAAQPDNPTVNTPPTVSAIQSGPSTTNSTDASRNNEQATTTVTAPTTVTVPTTTEPKPQSVVPDLTVTLLPEGSEFQLQNIIDGTTPVLVWFWAPH